MKAIVALLLAWLQAVPHSHASLQGRVIRFGTNEPVMHARIVLGKVGGQVEDYRTVMSEEDGAVELRDLSSGSYRLYAQRDGYVASEYGQRTLSSSLNPMNPLGVAITVTEGQELRDMVITMMPLGTIAGRVTDDNRSPIP